MAIRSKQKRAAKNTTSSEEVVLIDNLTGGLELNTAQSNLAADQARRLLNFSLEEPGLLITLAGYSKISTTSLGSRRAQGGQRVYTTSGAFTLVADNGSIYKPTDAGVWGSAVSTGWHTTNQIFFPHDRVLAIVMDGATAPDFTKNGTTFYDLGIAAPAAPTTADLAGGTLTATNVYKISVTYATTAAFDSEIIHESNGPAEVSHTLGVGNGSIRVTIARSTDPKVNFINVYVRNSTTGQTVLRKHGSVANPGAGNATYDITSEVAATAAEIPTNHDLPPNMAFGASWKNRMWGRHATIKNRIHFTQVFENQTWPANFFVDLPMEKGDDIEAMVPLGDILVCFGVAGVYLIIGQTSLDFEVRPALSAETGAFGARAAFKVEAGVIHAGPPGVYLFDGASDRFLSSDIDKGWKNMVTNSSPADLAKVAIAYHRSLKHVAVAVPNLYPTGVAGEWVLDLNRSRQKEKETWFSTNRTIGGYIIFDGKETAQGNAGRLFSWNTTTVELFEERTGTTANGSNFVAEYEGPVFTTQLKHAIAVQAFIEYEPTDGTLAFEFFVDGVTQGVQNINLGTGLATYGSATYNVSTYGGASRKTTVLTLPLPAEGRNFHVVMTYQGMSRFRLLGYGFSLVTEAVITTL